MPSPKKHNFEIKPVIEQRIFTNPAVQNFFATWTKIHDESLKLKVIPRSEWNNHIEQVRGIAEEKANTQTLFIPEDLQLWEIIGIIEAVDKKTFTKEPEKAAGARKKLDKLATLFQNAGVYIAQRLDKIQEGREIARALSQEFYAYGQFLEQGRKVTIPSLDEIKSKTITSEEIEEVDQFLAGEALYKARKKRLEQEITKTPAKRGELYEIERIKALSQFFRTAKKAFLLQAKSEQAKLKSAPTKLKPEQSYTPIHNAFLQKVKEAIAKQIETPKTELTAAIFRRGRELLQRLMPFDELPEEIKNTYLNWQNGESTLRKALKIDEMKEELANIRAIGNIKKMAQKEKQIADKIQKAVSDFPYEEHSYKPSQTVRNQRMNCALASMLGGGLMKEVGLNYLVMDLPGHSALLHVRSDGQIEWRDMQWRGSYTLESNINSTIQEIVNLSKNPKPEGLTFELKDPQISALYMIKEEQPVHIIVTPPEYGHLLQLLISTGLTFKSSGLYEEAIEAYKQAITLNPKYVLAYNNLGNVFYSRRKYKEAIEAYQQAIKIDPKYALAYFNLGATLSRLRKYNEAIEVYRKAIKANPYYAEAYNNLGYALTKIGSYQEAIEELQKAIEYDPELAVSYFNLGDIFNVLGRYKEAKEEYNKFLELANDPELIKQVKQKIAELEKKISH